MTLGRMQQWFVNRETRDAELLVDQCRGDPDPDPAPDTDTDTDTDTDLAPDPDPELDLDAWGGFV